jgi:hypothetical protein
VAGEIATDRLTVGERYTGGGQQKRKMKMKTLRYAQLITMFIQGRNLVSFAVCKAEVKTNPIADYSNPLSGTCCSTIADRSYCQRGKGEDIRDVVRMLFHCTQQLE